MSGGFILEDGWGGTTKGKIISDGSLKTFSTAEDLLQSQLRAGRSYYVSAGAVDWLGGTADANEYVFFEVFNNTTGDLLIKSAQVWLSPAYTSGPYTEVTDQYVRFNQWLSTTPYLNTSGNDAIDANLNRTSTNSIPVRDNGNSAIRNADAGDAVAIPPKTPAAGYICGFITSSDHGKVEMLPGGQGVVIGRGQSWIVACKPIQNSTPTNQLMGCRASVIELAGVGE